MGVMAGYGRPIVGYSLDTQIYKDRLAHLFREIEEDLLKSGGGLAIRDGLAVEDFRLLNTAITAGSAMTPAPPSPRISRPRYAGCAACSGPPEKAQKIGRRFKVY